VWHRAIGKEDRFLPLKQTILQGSDPSSPTSTDATLSYVPVVASINDTRFAPLRVFDESRRPLRRPDVEVERIRRGNPGG
jgi:hypothetical protein